MGFDEHGAGQPLQRGGVGEDPDDVGTTFDLLVEPFQRIVDQIFFQCGTGKSAKAVMSLSAWRSHAHHRREKGQRTTLIGRRVVVGR